MRKQSKSRRNSLWQALKVGMMVSLAMVVWAPMSMALETSGETVEWSTMTVTAQKTEENETEVPISMNIFDDISIDNEGLSDLEDLSYQVANFYLLNVSDFGPYKPTVRGLSSYAAGLGTSVGLYIDGVMTYNGLGFNTQLDDIERVEVLRGPQGTLYGSGSEAGVINVITKKPGNNTEGKISLEYGEENKIQTGVNIRGPIVKDKFFIGITARYYEKEGFIESGLDGSIVDDRKNYFGKIYLRATPSDRLELDLISSLYETDDGGLRRNSISAEDPRVYMGNGAEEIENRYQSHSLNINYAFDAVNLSSATVYSDNEMHSYVDADYSSATIAHYDSTTPIESMSEELKLDGVHGKLKWLIGLFANKAEKTGGWVSDSILPASQQVRSQEITEENLGVFAHLDYSLNDKVSLLGGLRYDRGKSELYDCLAAGTGTTEFSGSETFDNISPKIAVRYKPVDSLMTYATISKGYRMGGFYAFAATGYPKDYDSETLWNYEVGIKSSFLDNKMSLNADVFYMDVSDLQTVTYIGQYLAYMSNAAESTIYGAELEVDYRVTKNVHLFGAFGYNEAKFDRYEDAKGDYDGNYNPYAPKYNYSLGGNFRGFGGVFASIILKGYGEMYLDNANTYEKDAYALVDAKIGYEHNCFDFYLYADNLFDENYDMIGYGGAFTLMNPGREIGAKLQYRF